MESFEPTESRSHIAGMSPVCTYVVAVVFKEKIVQERVEELRGLEVAHAFAGQRNDQRFARGGRNAMER